MKGFFFSDRTGSGIHDIISTFESSSVTRAFKIPRPERTENPREEKSETG